MNEEDVQSPTVAIETLILSCIIDGVEGSFDATWYIPGAFMHADMDKELEHLTLPEKWGYTCATGTISIQEVY